MTTETLVSLAVSTGRSMAFSITSIVSGCRLGSSRRMAGKGNLTSTLSGTAGPTISVSVCDIVLHLTTIDRGRWWAVPTLRRLYYQHREAGRQDYFWRM